jgi:hypothetical protein
MYNNSFQNMAGNLDKFDGNPYVNFGSWCDKFLDQIGLIDNLNELQKLNRLKVCLSGIARKEMEKVPDPATGTKTLQYVIDQLKTKFPSTLHHSSAKQQLLNCRQAPGEPVHQFANRFILEKTAQ